MEMYDPPHPGRVLYEAVIEGLALSPEDFAEGVGVSVETMRGLLEARADVNAEIALRLARALNTSPEFWMGLQRQYDLWQARTRLNLETVKRYSPPSASP